MKSEVLKYLEQTKNLILNKNKWGKGSLFYNDSYCVYGALREVCTIPYMERLIRNLLNDVAKKLGYKNCIILNDNCEHCSVITMLNITIQFIEDGIITV